MTVETNKINRMSKISIFSTLVLFYKKNLNINNIYTNKLHQGNASNKLLPNTLKENTLQVSAAKQTTTKKTNSNDKLTKPNEIIQEEGLDLSESFIDKNNEEKINSIVSIIKEDIKNINSIIGLKQYLQNFIFCNVLQQNATNVVLFDGIIDQPEYMIIGEAPGQEEDRSGIPFCGKAGSALRDMLYCYGITADKNLYITNSVFWRPEGNRNPTNEEITICKPIVEKQIEIIKPKKIITFGAIATKMILGLDNIQISKFTFTKQKYQAKHSTIPVIPAFHPSYMLRNFKAKKHVCFEILKLTLNSNSN